MNDLSHEATYGTHTAVEEANAWVARFAPLVMGDLGTTEGELKDRLALIDSLKAKAPSVDQGLKMLVSSQHDELRQTFNNATAQLDSIEADLRRRLARVAPGDPAGLPDLDALQQRLQERAARQEMGLPTEVPAVLEMQTSSANIPAALFLGVFALGWLSFTTFHAVLMIGGMFSAFGWPALALLAFYAIFFLVGFGMAGAAVAAASKEHIELNGRELVVKRKLLGKTFEKRFLLSPDSRAEVGLATNGLQPGSRRRVPTPAVLIPDADARPVTLATHSTPAQRELIANRINSYLQAQP